MGHSRLVAPPSDTQRWVDAIDKTAHDAPRPAIVTAIAQRYSVARMVDTYAALLERAARDNHAIKQSEPRGTGVARSA